MPQDLSSLRRRVSKVPDRPGIYRWKDSEGSVLYVGKAKNLRSRMKSYVQKEADKGLGPWKLALIAQIADFETTVTNSELEALVLETNFIKQLRPKYNILMKDGKNYVYVRATLKDLYPHIDVVRQMEKDNARYFGPFISNYDTKKTLDMLNDLFCFRACQQSIDALNKAARHGEPAESMTSSPVRQAQGDALSKLRPCLEYQIGQCCGLCAGVMSPEEYKSRIERVVEFFKGNYKPVIDQAKEVMQKAAAERKFEKASQIRDVLKMIEGMQERQIVSDTSGENVDIFGLALLSGKVQVVLLHKRNGKLIGEEQFSLMGRAESLPDVLEQFLPQYYEAAADIPDAVIVGEDFPSREAFEMLLSENHVRKVKVLIPERGHKSQLLELAEQNAQEKAKQIEASWEADQRNTENALAELSSLLELQRVPDRIEGYDISHTGGTETVGSMVVFVHGKPKNEHYRSFTIHTMSSGVVDDYRALKEVLTRRLRHAAGGFSLEEERWNEEGVTFGRSRKAEQETLQKIVDDCKEECVQGPVDYKEFFVAREQGEIIGLACLHEDGVTVLQSVWVNETYRGGKLGQFLVRLFLRPLKKGKVYTLINPSLELYYASIGFRHVIKAPPVILEKTEKDATLKDKLVMVYDTVQNKIDVSLSAVPDLLVIDGGKGQLGVATEVLHDLHLDIPVIGLAKREEEVFVPGKSVSLLIPKDSPAKFLLMRLRDEAHRFANRHRTKRVTKSAMLSRLDVIPGIGPDTRQKLLQRFGSADGVRRATDEELLEILTAEQLNGVKEYL